MTRHWVHHGGAPGGGLGRPPGPAAGSLCSAPADRAEH